MSSHGGEFSRPAELRGGRDRIRHRLPEERAEEAVPQARAADSVAGFEQRIRARRARTLPAPHVLSLLGVSGTCGTAAARRSAATGG